MLRARAAKFMDDRVGLIVFKKSLVSAVFLSYRFDFIGVRRSHPASTCDGHHGLELLEERTMIEQSIENRISIMVYEDLKHAFDYLKDAFKLGPAQLARDDDGCAVHGELDAGDGVIWLHKELDEFGLPSPESLGGTTSTITKRKVADSLVSRLLVALGTIANLDRSRCSLCSSN